MHARAHFLGGVAVMTFSLGGFYLAAIASVGPILVAGFLIKDWWALLGRPPPRKTR
jgi:hypothetical protein